MKNNLTIEIIVAVFLLILIIVVPSTGRSKFDKDSNRYQHNAAEMTATASEAVSISQEALTAGNITVVNSFGAKGGFSAYAAGTFTEPTAVAVVTSDSTETTDSSEETSDETAESAETTESIETTETDSTETESQDTETTETETTDTETTETEEVKKVENPTENGVLTQDLRLRSSTSIASNDNVVTTLTGGTDVVILEANVESDDPDVPLWCHVKWNDYEGYVSQKYIEFK